jgi:hypothetical protein
MALLSQKAPLPPGTRVRLIDNMSPSYLAGIMATVVRQFPGRWDVARESYDVGRESYVVRLDLPAAARYTSVLTQVPGELVSYRWGFEVVAMPTDDDDDNVPQLP